MITGAGARLRPYQKEAVSAILQAYRDGATDVVLSAPTGSGKTYIASAVLDKMGRGIYGPPTLDLQAQYLRDFSMVPKIQSHTNYCLDHERHMEKTEVCPECIGDHDDWRGESEYGPRAFSAWGLAAHLMIEHGAGFEEARYICEGSARKVVAMRSRLVNANPSYLFREWMGQQWFAGRNLLVVDEADKLESVVDSAYEQTISVRTLTKYGWEKPGDDALHSSLVRALRDAYMTAKYEAESLMDYATALQTGGTQEEKVEAVDVESKAETAKRHSEIILKFLERASVEHTVLEWTSDELKATAVRPGDALNELAWPHVSHRLFMSGSIANAPMWARWMGLDPATTAFVDVESIFDPKMSPIQLWRGGPQMTGNGYQDSAKVESIVAAINAYRSGRTLVHVYSAQQARILKKHIPDAITYGTDDRRGRAEALKMYLARPDSLLIAQSMRRGVDLHDDKCRTNIIAKVPWSVPVRKVKARKALDSGYYVRETVQEVIQALGRGTRGPEDWCRNYIIDGSFTGLERNFPKYLRDAVIIT